MSVSTTLKGRGHRNIPLHMLSIKNMDVLPDQMRVQMFVHRRGLKKKQLFGKNNNQSSLTLAATFQSLGCKK